jgi:polyribonucleotide nucleotidyltransferase
MLDKHFALKPTALSPTTEASRRPAPGQGGLPHPREEDHPQADRRAGIRADGRKPEEIRPIEMPVGVFPRTHGSAFFQRGETQSLVSCTLGTGKDEQIIDGLLPEYSKKFTLHYNFPPFCTGEAKRIMGPGRREIGHGALAERSLLGILPSPEEFPYTIRVVSDITESNGSSSMASVCGGCLALMDAGVPIKATCAGISVGRFTDDNDKNELFVTDIIGEEDFFGDMDFKVSGTREGITGIQLDLKARGLISQIERSSSRPSVGRLEIIDEMEKVIAKPRARDLPVTPPSAHHPDRPVEKIGKLIGPGGKTIRALQDKYGVTIDVEDDGTVHRSLPQRRRRSRGPGRDRGLCEEIKVGTDLRRARSSAPRTSARSSSSPRAPTACATSPSSPTATSRACPTSSRSATS